MFSGQNETYSRLSPSDARNHRKNLPDVNRCFSTRACVASGPVGLLLTIGCDQRLILINRVCYLAAEAVTVERHCRDGSVGESL